MHTTKVLLAAAALGALLSAMAAATTPEYGEISEAEWQMGPPADYPEANAVVIFDRAYQVVEVPHEELYPQMEMRRHVRMKVLTRAGVDEIGNGQFPYHTEAGLADVRAHTITPSGEVYEVTNDAYFVKKVGHLRMKTFAFPRADSGCIVEFSYRIFGDGLVPLDVWYFHHPVYTMESSYTLEMGGGFNYVYQTRNIPESQRRPSSAEVEGLGKEQSRAYTWKLTNLLPLRPEPYMTCVEEYMSSVQVRFTQLKTNVYAFDMPDTWVKLGMQMEKYLNDYISRPRTFKKEVRDVIKGCKTDHEKAKAAYRHVVEHFETRQENYYMSTLHDKMSDCWREHYGTALEKNILLLDMLHAAGVKAWPVLISTRDHAHLDPEWLDLGQFSHMIVFAEMEEGGIYLDATSKYNSFGTLPPACRTSSGLMLDGDKSELVRIVTNDPASYRIDLVSVSLQESGQAACSTTAVFTGYLAAEYGRRFETSEPDDFIEDHILHASTLGSGYRGGSHETLVDTLGAFRVMTDFSIEGAARRLDQNLVFNAPCCMLGESPFRSDRRFFPIDFNYGFIYQNIARITVPEGAVVSALPNDTAFGVDGIMFERRSYQLPEGAQLESKVTLTRPFFDVNEYLQVRSFFDEVAEAVTSQVVFTVGGE